MITQYYYFFKK